MKNSNGKISKHDLVERIIVKAHGNTTNWWLKTNQSREIPSFTFQTINYEIATKIDCSDYGEKSHYS